MRTVDFEIYAAPGEMFAPEAFTDCIGKTLDVRLSDATIVAGRVLNAEVYGQGSCLALSVEIPTEQE